MTQSVRLAVVQPRTEVQDPPKNVARAIGYLEQAAALGAQVVCFPETYPGPWTPPLTYDPLPELAGRARDLDVYVVAGCLEPVPGEPGRYHNCLVLLGPEGTEVGRYRRTTPRGPWIYRGGRFWDFSYREGSELPVFDTRHGRLGLLVCSEVYVPELARELALKGAELILMPAGLWKRAQWETWRVLTRARAVENLVYTATCQNVVGGEGHRPGLAMICSPEEVLAESTSEGVLVADCDLERIRFLRREEDRPNFPGEKACKAGVLWQWYRPELYSRAAAERPAVR
ncbi:MAG TPA: carbon-nitrogen hydrolase family protein [Actinomycetota bacterium]|nr:carbon-nitrogen hydrolase family protein [Actinomycetota bacterium]